MIWTQRNGQWREVMLHNSARGLVGFIVCNGPSLKGEDTSRLQGIGRLVVAVNNSAPRVRPDWWVGMDEPECFDKCLFAEPYPKLVRRTIWDRFQQFPNCYTPDLQENVAFYDGGEKDVYRWDHDSFRVALQHIIYLGVRKIYLLGVDLDLSRHDYADGDYLTDAQRVNNKSLYDATFEFLRAHSNNRPAVQLLSCSKGSRINTFLRYEPLDKVLRSIEKRVPKGRTVKHNSTLR